MMAGPHESQLPALYQKTPMSLPADLEWEWLMRVDSVGREHPHGIRSIALGVDQQGNVYLFTRRGEQEMVTPLNWDAAASLSIAAGNAAGEGEKRANGPKPRPDGFCDATPPGQKGPVCSRRPHDPQTAHESADFVWMEGEQDRFKPM